MVSREQQLVELVDAAGTATGSCTVQQAHYPPGLAHRAFSVLLVDPTGRLLLQRRAAVKSRFALLWANTCCGHPAPGEHVPSAAAKRLAEEVGITGVTLREVGVHRYHADDSITQRVEIEHDHVLVGSVTAGHWVRPDPAEVAAVRWISPDRLAADLVAAPERYVPWLLGVFTTWHSTL